MAEGLYLLNSTSTESYIASTVVPNPFSVHVNIVTVNKSHILWHHRLGHLPFAKLNKITCINVPPCDIQPFICDVCPLHLQENNEFIFLIVSLMLYILLILFMSMCGDHITQQHTRIANIFQL